jgi:hypothetical protein
MIHFIVVGSSNRRNLEFLHSFLTKKTLYRPCPGFHGIWPLPLPVDAFIALKYRSQEEHEGVILPRDLVDLPSQGTN